MIETKPLFVGAEAEIIVSTYHEKPVILKNRRKKSYRVPELDQVLISSRTKEEAKLIMESRQSGVYVPFIYDVDIQNGSITMEYLKGKRIKDLLPLLTEEKRTGLCHEIGRNIARLHNHDLIHGDLTTSNMILVDDHVYFIDFGLGSKDGETELKGVDLHVLMEAFSSTHSQYPQCFPCVLEGYIKEFKGDNSQVKKKIDDIVRRGRYRS